MTETVIRPPAQSRATGLVQRVIQQHCFSSIHSKATHCSHSLNPTQACSHAAASCPQQTDGAIPSVIQDGSAAAAAGDTKAPNKHSVSPPPAHTQTANSPPPSQANAEGLSKQSSLCGCVSVCRRLRLLIRGSWRTLGPGSRG